MKRVLQIVAVLVVLSALAFWAAKGANLGWSKNAREVKTLDEVTGLEAISYEEGYWPGVTFLGGALVGAGALAGASLLTRNKPKTQN